MAQGHLIACKAHKCFEKSVLPPFYRNGNRGRVKLPTLPPDPTTKQQLS